MAFELPPLPYAYDALEPHMSERTLRLHYDKHHKGYVDKLNALTEGTEFAGRELEAVIVDTSLSREHTKIFNNAAQVWNHTFYWDGMKPAGGMTSAGGGMPPSDELRIARLIEMQYGDFDNFKKLFIQTSVDRFGSGYTWLVSNGTNLEVVSSANAETPIAGEAVPVLNCDLWEHAYYLDHQNERATFVERYLGRLVDWTAVDRRLRDQAPELARQVA